MRSFSTRLEASRRLHMTPVLFREESTRLPRRPVKSVREYYFPNRGCSLDKDWLLGSARRDNIFCLRAGGGTRSSGVQSEYRIVSENRLRASTDRHSAS